MERSSKLADLKLVAKYYPVTNYSYPQSDRLSQHGQGRGRFSDDRASLGSNGSAPGLIDDRTDSEVSFDDDYQYHAHAAELWDSFWQPSKPSGNFQPVPKKQYPALIPSPRDQKRQAILERRPWPLPECARSQGRKPAASYSPFPKPLPLPPRVNLMTPSWQSSRPSIGKPPRPPRPEENRCSQTSQPFVTLLPTSPDPFTTHFSSPATPKEPRPETASEIRSATPAEARNSTYSVYSLASAAALLPPDFKPVISKKSMPCLRAFSTPKKQSAPKPPPKPLPTPTPEPKVVPEPHSIFEDDDSDTEETGSGVHRSFFRFHKRSGSYSRKGVKSSGQHQTPDDTHHTRTAPPSPTRRPPPRTAKSDMSAERKRHGGDVINRMLGRRRSRG